MTSVEQSGLVTPGHLTSWTTDGVLQDAGVTFSNSFGLMAYTKSAINFNAANTDNPLLVNLPAGYTRYKIRDILISNASATLTTATCGVFTQAAGAGVAVVAGSTAVTVNTAGTDTNNNMQSLTIANQATMALSDTTLFFRTQIAQGSAATADVTIFYQPLP